MKRTAILIGLSLAAAGCAYEGVPRPNKENLCGGRGLTTSVVRYGDSGIRVTPVSEIYPNSEFRLRLKPKRRKTDEQDYGQANVATVGKEETGNRDDWLNDEGGSFVRDRQLSICLGGVEPGEYEFKVIVEDVGVIDPRARVILR